MSCLIERDLDPEDLHTCSFTTLSRWTPDRLFVGPVSGVTDGWALSAIGGLKSSDDPYILSLPSPALGAKLRVMEDAWFVEVITSEGDTQLLEFDTKAEYKAYLDKIAEAFR